MCVLLKIGHFISTLSFISLASSCYRIFPLCFHLTLSFGIRRPDYREHASLCVSRMNQITERVDLGSFSRTAHKKQARRGNVLQTSRVFFSFFGGGEGCECLLHPDSTFSLAQSSRNTCTVYLCPRTEPIMWMLSREKPENGVIFWNDGSTLKCRVQRQKRK